MSNAANTTFHLFSLSQKRFTNTIYKIWEDYDKSADSGSEDSLITVEELGPHHYKLTCEVYYSSYGVFSLEITQPLNHALLVFTAAFNADTDEEG